MTLNHYPFTRDKEEEILTEKRASSLFIQIDNSNLLNLNIIRDNEAINRIVPPSPNLVLANRITMIFSQ